MADWSSFTIQVPGKDILEPVRGVLETLLIFLEILKTILETIKVFLIDFGNPIRVLVEMLIKTIQELFNSLKQSGFFMYLDVPNPVTDPNFDQMKGGFDAFVSRFQASLFDTKDFNRPQPRGSNQGGFVILMVDAASAGTLIQSIKRLMAFFGKGFDAPRFMSPENFKVLPVGADGDPILAAAKVFSSGTIESVQLQWTLPSTQEKADPGFTDVLQRSRAELIPPNFLIERAVDVNPASRKIDIGDLSSADAVGVVEYDRKTAFEQAGAKITKKESLLDDSGEPVIKFQKYTVVGAPTQILGALGKFRYIDSDVEVDKDYYYRVRAFAGDLDVDGSGKVNFSTSIQQDFGSSQSSSKGTLKWPSASSDDVSMGRSTGIVKTRIPPDTGDFEVVNVLEALYKTAFSLDFHQPLKPESKFNSDGTPLDDSTPNSQVGLGSLTNVGGIVSGWASTEVLSWMANYDTIPKAYSTDAITGNKPEMPWTKFLVIRQSAKLADQVATAMLGLGSDGVTTFKNLMRSLPKGAINVPNLTGLTTLEKVVLQFTEVEDTTIAALGISTQEATLKAVEAYAGGYTSVELRLNVLAAIKLLSTFTQGGTPPDWISIVPLRDIIPWAGGFIYDLLDKIQALLDAFNGVMQEIRDFIDLLVRKIGVMEDFIQYLINLLNFIESLEIGAYLLAAPQVSGTAAAWVDAVGSAGGDRPSTGPNGYSAGIALAYVAPDVAAFVTIFSIIFGA
jgi:hypothetical protein